MSSAGRLSLGDALLVLPSFVKDKSEYVVESSVRLVEYLRDADLVPDELLPRYASYVRRLYGKEARRLGWTHHGEEDEDTTLLRQALVPFVAGAGQDKELADQATTLAKQWLKDHQSLAPDIVGAVLDVAAAHGNKALFSLYQAAAAKETSPEDRRRLLEAMTSFRDEASVRAALALMLGKEIDPRDAAPLMRVGLQSPRTRALPYAFVKEHYDELVARLPREIPAYFPFLAAGQCDERVKADMVAFFKERASNVESGARKYQQALESLDQCVALKKAQGPAVAKFLRAQ
jgi:alanyl aminopeptidase